MAALRHHRIDEPCLFDCPINGERFPVYVEQFLVQTLRLGDIVVLDNLGSHEGTAGAQLLFLPKYSPTSTRSNRSSPSSRRFCEKPPPDLWTPSAK
jgi:transposase